MKIMELIREGEQKVAALADYVSDVEDSVKVPHDVAEAMGMVVALGCISIKHEDIAMEFNNNMAALTRYVYLAGYKHAMKEVEERANA